jgi:hypothetical protein
VNGFLEIGDLVRMCGMNEPWAVNPDSIDWCYGIFVGVRENPHAFMEKQDLVVYNGMPMLFDHYWYKEKIA